MLVQPVELPLTAHAEPSPPPRSAARDSVEPLTADLSRLHVTVSRRFLGKLDAARDALSHSNASADSDHIPAHVKRAVWLRDGGRCQWRMEDGSVCGSTFQAEFDHIHPQALGGPSTVENVRVACRGHNQLAARRAFGNHVIDRYTKGRAREQADGLADPLPV